MTYVALAMLLILGDDFSRVDKKAIVGALPWLRSTSYEGGICCVAGGSESDMRYVYVACCISYMLNDWSGMDKEKTCKFILSCQSYDCAIAQEPGAESHGGSTYCAVASLALMNMLDRLPNKDELLKWLIQRQIIGFQGRPNKLQDTCYSFWIGATLRILGHFDLVMPENCRNFTLNCQQKIGGFSKWPDQYPDVLHTYLGFCGLSFLGEPGLGIVHPGLGISQRAHDRLKEIHGANFTPTQFI